MASTGQAIGAVVGAFVGTFTPVGPVVGAQIGATIGGAIDPPKGPNLRGPTLSDLSLQTSSYGATIPRLYGNVTLHGNVFWIEGNALRAVTTKTKSGGKGGGGKTTTTTTNYYATFAVGIADTLGRGEIAGVRKIWFLNRLIYDAGSDDLETIIASNNSATSFKLYTGSDTQLPNPRMQADIGAADCPAYRGLAYLAFYDIAMADYSNSLAALQIKVEVVGAPPIDAATLVASYTMPGAARNYVTSAMASDDDGVIVFKNQAGLGVASNTDVFRMLTTGAVVPIRTITPLSYGTHYDGWSDVPVLVTGTAGGVVYVQDEFGSLQTSVSGVGVTSDNAQQHSYYRRAGVQYLIYASASETTIWEFSIGAISAKTELQKTTAASPRGLVHDMFPAADGGLYVVTTSGFVVAYDASMVERWAVDISANMGLITNNVGEGEIIIREAALDDLVLHQSSGFFRVSPAGFVHIAYAGGNPAGYEHHGGQHLIGLGLMAFVAASTGKVDFIRIQTSDNANVPLATIIVDEMTQSGLIESSDVDVSAITHDVRGYRVATVAAIRAALEPLRGAFPFDVIQSGYKIKAVPRGTVSVMTIPAEDLDARPAGDSPGVSLSRSVEMDTQLPARVSVQYLDVLRDQDVGEQYDTHPATAAVGVKTFDMPIVFTPSEALSVASALIDMYWIERNVNSFTLGPTYAALEPADVVTVQTARGAFEMRISQIDYLSDGRLKIVAPDNATAVYSPNVIGAESTDTGKTLAISGPSIYQLLDIPLLRDQDNAPGYPAAMTGASAGWPGGVVFRSSDGGQTWDALQGFSGPVPLGYSEAVVATGRFDMIDWSVSINVRLYFGDLFSVTRDAMLGGANWFAFGAGGRWEIVAAQEVTVESNGTLTLAGLLRGRAGTEWAAALHQANDVLVQLDDADLAWIAETSAAIGQGRLYRGITFGRDISTDSDRAYTYNAVNLKPLSPVSLNGHRHPSTNDWTLKWIRRGRIDAQWRDLVDVPIGETAESYEIDIFSAGTYTTLKRTLTSATPTVAYTSAQQVTDFGSNQATLYVRVYQMSAAVGRGYALQSSITR